MFEEVNHNSAKVELLFARFIERDEDVRNWLCHFPKEFNNAYYHDKTYKLDFVVETEDIIYLVEVTSEKSE